jgi:hypothetical protein
MGASDWTYFVPYQRDINAALQAIRQQVFERGRYYEVDYGDWRTIDEAEMRRQLADEEPELFDILLEDWRRVKNLPEPDSIERLIDWNGEEGTHTIMDISRGISEERESGTLSPLTEAQLVEAFNTTKPTHEQVVRWVDTAPLYNFRGRGEGLYIIVYQGDRPSELCFTGFSGD